ncbi:MAG: hypothetical protein AAGI69_30245 [Cyanobacteria bacterium P01_H01_bin.21]
MTKPLVGRSSHSNSSKTPDIMVAISNLVVDAVLITNDQQLLGLDGVKPRTLKMKEAE